MTRQEKGKRKILENKETKKIAQFFFLNRCLGFNFLVLYKFCLFVFVIKLHIIINCIHIIMQQYLIAVITELCTLYPVR